MAKTNKKNNNKLDFNTIKKANDSVFTTKTLIISVDGKDYEVQIDQVFKTTKIEKMVLNFIQSEDVKEVEKLSDSTRLAFFMYLIIKNFTDLDIPDGLDLAEQLNLINSLIDLGIFEAIMKEISDSEIQKVNDYMNKFNLNLDKVIEEMKNNENVDEFIFNENVIVNEDNLGDTNGK